MAVQSDTSRISYAGNNSTSTSYAVPFVFLENGHLKAIAKTSAGVEGIVALTNHTGAASPTGGTVRTAVAVPSTSTLTIYRDVPLTQTTNYAEGGDFPAASHERALDKLTTITQQLDRRINTCVRGSEATPLATLPSPIGTQQFVLATTANQPPAWQPQSAIAIGPVIATGSSEPRFVSDRFADVVSVKDFGAVGDGVADDASAIQAAIDAAATNSNGFVYLLKGATHSVGSRITMKAGVTLDLNGSTLVPTFTGASGVEVITVSTLRQHLTSESIALTPATSSITPPAGSQAVTGDTIQISNFSSPRASYPNANAPSYTGYDYYNGVLFEATVAGGSIHMSHHPQESFTGTDFYVYESANNCTIRNGTIFCNVEKGKGIFGFANNVLVQNVKVLGIGLNAIFGITLNGANNVVERCYVSTFMDKSGSINGRQGYGIALFGHNSYSLYNHVHDCKHCFTSGPREYYGEGVTVIGGVYDNNNSELANEAPMDCHANCRMLIMDGVQVRPTTTAMLLRNESCKITNCSFIANSSSSSQRAIFLWEDDKTNLFFSNNYFKILATGGTSSVFNIYEAADDMSISGMVFCNNLVDGAGFALIPSGSPALAYTGDITDLTISNNSFINIPSHGFFLDTDGTGTRIRSQNNTYHYGCVSTGNGARLDVATLADPLIIDGDRMIYGGATSTSNQSIRIVARTVSGITFSGTTATATSTAHGFTSSDQISIRGATGADAQYYNGDFSITVTGDDTFTYTMTGTPAGNATGTIAASYPSTGKIIPRNCTLDRVILDETQTYQYEWFNNAITDINFVNGVVSNGHVWKGDTRIFGSKVYKGAPPTTGAWLRGDVIYNTLPSASNNPAWVCVASGTAGTWVPLNLTALEGSATYDPPSLNNAATTTTTVTVTGAALGNYAEAAFNKDMAGVIIDAWVSAADTVTVRFSNESGGTVDFTSGTLRARVFKSNL